MGVRMGGKAGGALAGEAGDMRRCWVLAGEGCTARQGRTRGAERWRVKGARQGRGAGCWLMWGVQQGRGVGRCGRVGVGGWQCTHRRARQA